MEKTKRGKQMNYINRKYFECMSKFEMVGEIIGRITVFNLGIMLSIYLITNGGNFFPWGFLILCGFVHLSLQKS